MNQDPLIYKYNTAVANFQIAQNMVSTALQNKNMKQAEFYQESAQKYLQLANYYFGLIQNMKSPVEFEFGRYSKKKSNKRKSKN